MHHAEQALDLSEARRIVLTMLKDYAVDVYLFGSAAKGTMSRSSDIDIAVLPKTQLPTGLLADIREVLEQSNILYRVDLVDLSETSEGFKAKVLKEGKLWND